MAVDALLLTHGAGGDRNHRLLVALQERLVDFGIPDDTQERRQAGARGDKVEMFAGQ